VVICRRLARTSVSALEAAETPKRNRSGILLALERLPSAYFDDPRRYQIGISGHQSLVTLAGGQWLGGNLEGIKLAG
jgi:hypothetical protein